MSLGPQPNFEAMAQNMVDLSQEFLRCVNLPAIDNGQRILAVLQDMQVDIGAIKGDVSTLKADVGILKADVSTLKADVGILKADVSTLKVDVSNLKGDVSTLKMDVANINTRLDNIDTRLDNIDNRTQASDANSISRLINNSITSPDAELEPLRSLLDNTIIHDLSTSADSIKRFTGPKLNQILSALGLENGGDVNIRRKRLLHACGFVLSRM
ncbi:hypothetical protein F4781DRAFT_411024 [Annulohypoxylon bovei var. microspora]|nr:hypothetical protein F4781DRAFT_411024 [Annulohypoxylon bovei var. microspora]